MYIQHHFENAIDQALLYYMDQLFSSRYPSRPLRECGRFLFLAAVPFSAYHACAYPIFRIASATATIAYVAFKMRQYLLHYSASEGKIKLMKVMLFLGADVNRGDLSNLTPLHHAANNSQNEAIKILLQYKADPNKDIVVKSGFDYPNTPINWIVDEGNTEGFEIIENYMLKNKLSLDYSILLDVAKNAEKKNQDLISKIQEKI